MDVLPANRYLFVFIYLVLKKPPFERWSSTQNVRPGRLPYKSDRDARHLASDFALTQGLGWKVATLTHSGNA